MPSRMGWERCQLSRIETRVAKRYERNIQQGTLSYSYRKNFSWKPAISMPKPIANGAFRRMHAGKLWRMPDIG